MSSESHAQSSREERLHAILASYLTALEEGRQPDRDALLQQHPDLAAELRAFFMDHDRMGRTAAQIRARLALGPQPPTTTEAPPPGVLRVRYLGDYELLEELGRGGMGVVYKARQRSLNRLVALKMILSAQFATSEEVARFRREAQALAQLDHPGIVPLYEIGKHEGQWYFSMKWIDGNNLGHELPYFRANHRAAAYLLAKVARAVDAAHQRSILHRDLKPGNILLDANKQPHVTDFGLAKRLDGASSLSPVGAVVGTPGYMAPEQAAVRTGRLSRAADIYSLGAVLYEMLTGQPPFRAETPLETLMQVVESEPPPPRQINPKIDRDLEIICLKCLDKRPRRRYASGEKLAQDLENWVERKPIQARRVGRAERASLWCRRRPSVVGVTAVTFLAIVLGSGIATVNYVKIRAAQQREQQDQEERDRLNAQISREIEAQKEKDERLRKAIADKQEQDRIRETEKEREREQGEDRAERNRRLRDREQRLANQEGAAVVATRYEADMRKAALLAESEDYEAVFRLLKVWEPAPKAHDYRHWEWHYLQAVAARSSLIRPYQADPKSDDEWYFSLPGHGHSIARIDWSPEGRRLAVYDSQGWLRVLDVVSGREVFALQVENPDPQRNISLDSRIQWRPDAWSATGDRLALAAAEGAVKIVDAATGKQVVELPKSRGRTPLQHDNPNGYRAIAWSPDGRRIAAGSNDGKVPIYDAGTGKEVQSLSGHEGPVLSLAWRDNGRQLASGGMDGKVKIWDVGAGREEYTLTDSPAVVALAWGPDGRQILASQVSVNPHSGAIQFGQGKSNLWDTKKREVVWSIPVTARRSSDFTWSTDGRRLGLCLEHPRHGASFEGQLLDAATGYVMYRGGQHPTGRVFADRQLRQAVQLTSSTGLHRRGFVLDLPNGQVSRVLVPWLSTNARNLPKYEGIERAAWGPDGTILALASTQGNLHIHHLPQAGQRSRTLVVPDAREGVAWESDSLHFRINSLGGSLPLNVEDQRKAYQQRPPKLLFPSRGILVLSSDGRRLAATLDDKSIQVWDVTTGKRTFRLAGHPRFVDPNSEQHSLVSDLRWSPHGKYLASYRAWDGTLKVWDAASGKELFGLDLGGTARLALDWSADETRLALSVMKGSPKEGETSILDAATGRRLSRLISEGFEVVAWSPDGKRLASTSSGRPEIYLWDSAKGNKVDVIEEGKYRADFAPCLAWDPSGRRVAWATSHRGGAIYDTKTRRVVGFQLDAGTRWTQLVWKPDGKQLAVTNTANVAVFDAADGAKVSATSGQSIAWTPGGPLAASLKIKEGFVETEKPINSMVMRTRVQETVIQVNNCTTDKTMALEPLAEETPPPKRLLRPPAPQSPGALGQFWSPDHKRFARLRLPRPGNYRTPTTVILHDAADKVERELVGEPEQINVGLKPLVAWSPDSKHVAGGGNNVRVWSAATGEEAFRLTGHDGVVGSIVWSLDGRRIITRSEVRKPFRNSWELKVWDATDGREIMTVRGLVAELTFNPALTACSFVLTEPAGNDQTIVLWDLSLARGKGGE